MRKWLRTNRFVHILYMFERILIGAVPNGLNRCSRFDKMNESFEWHRMHWVDLSHHQKCGTCCAIAISIFFSSYWKLSKFHISISIRRYRFESTSSFYEKQYLFASLSPHLYKIFVALSLLNSVSLLLLLLYFIHREYEQTEFALQCFIEAAHLWARFYCVFSNCIVGHVSRIL